MLFDTHAHYDDEAFDPDRREVLAGLPQKGVGLVVDPGCTLTSSEKAVALAAEFPHVYAAVGLHPENCHDFQPEQIERLRQLAQREKVVAIGEVGLDYYWEENPPRALQQEVLRRQLALAEQLEKDGKAVVIRPLEPLTIGRLDRKPQELLKLHDHGMECGLALIENIRRLAQK